jgi:hypothetical protein
MLVLTGVEDSHMEFRKFVEFLFDRPENEPAWYHDEGFVPPDLTAQTAVLHTLQLFRNIRIYASEFTEVQLCSGLNYLINPSCGDHCYTFLDASVLESDRAASLAAMYEVFHGVFQERCSDALSSVASPSIRLYNGICYMWWDVFPRHGISPPQTTDHVILDTLTKILALDSKACKESALHGFGHWHVGYPELVENAIDRNKSKIPLELKQYAVRARTGDVQ